MDPISEAIITKGIEAHLQQATGLLDFFRKQGYTGSGEQGIAALIFSLNSIYRSKFSDSDLKKIITDCSTDEKVDAIVFKEDSVDFFDVKKTETIKADDIRTLKESLFKHFGATKPQSVPRRLKYSLDIFHDKKNKRPNKRIFIVRTGASKEIADVRSGNKEIDQLIDELKVAGFDLFYLTGPGLISRITTDNPSLKWDFAITNVIEPCRETPGLRSLIMARIPLGDLMNKYAELFQRGIHTNLYEKNARLPFAPPKFDSGLRETLEQFPDKFEFFHNGLAITSTSLEVSARVFEVLSPQIVNGAQSVRALYDIYQDPSLRKSFKKAHIYCKFIKTDSKITADRISRTANTQSAVTPSDLRTNEDIQKEIRFLLESDGKYIYLTKKGEKKKPGDKRIAIRFPDLFQWAYTAFFEEPAKAKNQKKSLFQARFEDVVIKLRSRPLEIFKLCECAIAVQAGKSSARQKGFYAAARLHLLTGLFLIKSTGKRRRYSDAQNIVWMHEILKKYCDGRISKKRKLSYLYLLSQDNGPWLKLRDGIKKSL